MTTRRAVESVYPIVYHVNAMTDEGEPYVKEVILIMADEASGRRWVYQTQTEMLVGRDEGFVEMFARRISEVGSINPEFWVETDPVYGSLEYVEREAYHAR